MRLTRGHINFWRRKKEPKAPAWFDGVPGHDKEPAPDINALVNAHAGFKPNMSAHNTLVLLSLARSRGALVDMLTQMAARRHIGADTPRRAAFCKKWLRKISEARP